MAIANRLAFPEIVFATSEQKLNRQISKWETEGRLRKLAPRLYTANLEEDPAVIIRRNLFAIIGHCTRMPC